MNEDELIDGYLKNQLDSDAQNAFEKELVSNNELRIKLSLRKIVIEGISLSYSEELKEKLVEFDKSLESKKRFQFSWKMAASLAVFLTVGFGLYYYFSKPNPNDFQLAEAGLPIPMGVSQSIEFNNAMSAFKGGDFDKAGKSFEALLNANQQSDTLLYFSGWCNFRQNEIQEAIENWEQVKSESTFWSKAQFMTAISYWKLKDEVKATEILKQQSQSDNKEVSQSAQRALEKLK